MSRKPLVAIALMIAQLFWPAVSAGDIASNSVHDICGENLQKTMRECEILVKKLESDKNPTTATWLTIGEAYLGISHILQKQGQAKYADYREKAKLAYKKALVLEPGNVHALHGVAIFSSQDERAEILKKILQIAPDNYQALKGLSIYYSNSYLEADQLLALEYLLKGYQRSEGIYRWEFAQSIYHTYQRNHEDEKASRFRKVVFLEMGIHADPDEESKAESNLISACHRSALVSFSTVDICVRSILFFFPNFLPLVKTEKKIRLKLVEAMDSLLRQRSRFDGEKIMEIETELKKVFPAFELPGKSSLEYYMAYALLLDGEAKLKVLRKATESDVEFRKNTKWFKDQAVYALAEALRDQGYYREAEQLYNNIISGESSAFIGRALEGLKHMEQERTGVDQQI